MNIAIGSAIAIPTMLNPIIALRKKSIVNLTSLLKVWIAQAYSASLNDSLSVRATGDKFFSIGVLILLLPLLVMI
jgi:hypothetical protein